MKKKINKPYIIAETACSHDGSVARLKRMINASFKAGSDAIQFQVWNAENMVTVNNPNLNKMKKLEISYKNWRQIFEYTKKKYPSLEIIACIYDLEALEFANNFGANAFKIHSSDLGNKELLIRVSKLKKRVDLSVGGSTVKEISKALKILKKNDVWLMYGIQSFPTDPKNINLNKIKLYEKKFNKNVGYQDHSPTNMYAYLIPCASIGNGTCIIEKHITDTRERKGTDLESALNFKEFKNFVKCIRETYASLGQRKISKLNKMEEAYRIYSKKKIYLKKNLNKNYILKKSDLLIRQPMNKKGIPVDNLEIAVGKKLKKRKKKNDLLELKDIR